MEATNHLLRALRRAGYFVPEIGVRHRQSKEDRFNYIRVENDNYMVFFEEHSGRWHIHLQRFEEHFELDYCFYDEGIEDDIGKSEDIKTKESSEDVHYLRKKQIRVQT